MNSPAKLQEIFAKKAVPHLETHRIRFDRILLATDLSKTSRGALRCAMAVAQEFGSTLYVLNVVGADMGDMGYGEQVVRMQSRNSARALHKIARQLEHEHIKHQELLAYDSPVRAILNSAQDNRIDLIVTGTYGAEGLDKLLTGSVAEAVLRSSTCPVLVAGPHAGPLQMKFKSVFLAADLRPNSLRAAQYAVSIAEEMGARLTLAHVLQMEKGIPLLERQRMKDDAFEHLQELLPRDAGDWCQPNLRVAVGDVVEQTMLMALEEQADLIVAGAHNGHLLSDHAPWATLSKMLRSAPCPVLAVRDHLQQVSGS